LVRDTLDAAGMSPESAELAMVPTTTVPVAEEDEARKILRLLEILDDHDDVQNVWSNFDIPDEVLAAVSD
jgi:transcriptional/translational regulatory protein YebC/TACO1